MDLELEPDPPEPSRPPATDWQAHVRAQRRAARRDRFRAAAARAMSWRRFIPPMSRSFAISLGAHGAVFGLLALLWALRADAPQDRHLTLTIDLSSFVEAADPEATPGGSSPRAEAPQEKDRGAKSEVPGSIFDAELESREIGAGAAEAGSVFLGRTEGKERLLLAGGGDGATEGALRLALEWLARHQSADGTWDASAFGARCRSSACDGRGEAPYVEATTGLALLAFQGAGHDHRTGPWAPTVRRGLEALVARQKRDGSFGSDAKRGYACAIGALALADAYGLTTSAAIREPAQRAVTHLVRTQSVRGGWRYAPGDGATDSSVTGWAVLALASARRAGLDVPDAALGAARGWFASVTSEGGDIGYVARGGGSAALLGSGAFAQVMLGVDPSSDRLTPTFDLLERRLPRLPRNDAAEEYGVADPMHWISGALATFQRGGGTWRMWNEKLREVLLGSQVRDDTDARGSWAAFGATGRHGGRVVTTALCALSLEVYYRYPRATWR